MASLLPHLTSTGQAPTSREVVTAYRAAFAARVEEGSLRPLVVPYHMYGYFLLVAYLCIPHTNRPWVYAARWPVLGIIGWWQWKTLWETSSDGMATCYAAGLIAAWGFFWALTWLVLNRPQFDAKRIQRTWVKREGVDAAAHGSNTNGHTKVVANGKSSSSAMFSDGSSQIKQRTQNGVAKVESSGHTMADGKAVGGAEQVSKDDQMVAEYYWQSYPDNFKDRFFWVSDLTINFRGPGWNWAIPPLPSPPTSIMTQLSSSVDKSSKTGRSFIGLQRYDTFSALARACLPKFIVGYILLDIFKVVLLQDPYFIFGPTTYRLPSYLQGLSPITLHLIRQSLSAFAIVTALEMVFMLPPILLSLLLGQHILGQRAEPWYYSTTWGSFSNILDKGLNGLWGSWWHQLFRSVFSAPSNFLIKTGYVKPKSTLARLSALFFAFGISGVFHYAGSVSQFAPTNPSRPPIFFALQGVGIIIQTTMCSLLQPQIKNFPKSLRRAGNLAFVLIWLFSTSWLLTDDFARGGIWLFEPIPISPLRGMGFGETDAGWWCWEYLGVGWYSGKHWWDSGLAV